MSGNSIALFPAPLRARHSSVGPANRGQIQMILGPMFSGKSTELIRRLKRYQIARYECLIVKYAHDVRYDEEGIATHDKQVMKAVKATKLQQDLADKANMYDVIGIDEGQFFPDLTPFCESLADSGKTVIVAALDGTFQRKGFQNVMDLVPLSEHVVKLHAVCMSCFGEGAYTKRISADKEVEVVGGAEKYMAVCRRCHKDPATIIPSSPRLPLKDRNEDEVDVSPPKKALFQQKQQGKENTEEEVVI